MSKVKLPKFQYVIYFNSVKKYIGRYNCSKFVQNAKLYKSYESAKDAINQMNEHDSYNHNNYDYKIEEIEIDLVSDVDWKHEEYITSRRVTDE